jgi:alpha-tubulin suppressor-like RCC1 family protein
MRADRTVRCWGSNSSGQLGDGSFTDSPSPVVVAGLTVDAQLIAAFGRTLAVGSSHTCARRADLSMVCWGDNSQGQLGDGTYDNSPVPVTIPGVTQTSLHDLVTAGGIHTGVIQAGRPRFWGGNGSGQLGDGTTTLRSRPVALLLT